MTKICYTCKCIKLLNEFPSFYKKQKLYYRNKCKSCYAIYYKEREKSLSEDKKEGKRQKSKNWRKNNPYSSRVYKPRTLEQKLRYRINSYIRRRSNPILRLRDSISSLMTHALKQKGKSKSGKSFFNLINYSLEELKEHLEKLFTDKMNWDNYGSVWSLDHIRPISSYQITSIDSEDFKACWALSNLQPLLKEDNSSKGSLWEGKRYRF